jgi:DinB superfamily
METKSALKQQYHASLAMLRQAIDRCPDELWAKRDHPRDYWRIAYHALFYTDLYLCQGEADFARWELHRDNNEQLWAKPWKPGAGPVPYTKDEILSYCDQVIARVDDAVEHLDLESTESGYSWYTMPKFEHQLVNLRHLHQHAGQLSELLMAVGVETDWFARAKK